jgi:hypothetical protein
MMLSRLNRLLDYAEDYMYIKRMTQSITLYRESLAMIAQDIYNSNTNLKDARSSMRGLITDTAPMMFEDGFNRGGATIDEMDDVERAFLQDWISTQKSFVNGFIDYCISEGLDRSRGQSGIKDRISMWVAAAQAMENQAYAFAQENQMGEWRLGKTERHCGTCSKLDGQKHRLKWFTSRNYIPRSPGADLDCGGWRCDCGIFNPLTGKKLL